jgi:UPF0755 protein
VKLLRRLFLFCLVCAVAATAYAVFVLNTPYKGFGNETFVDLPKGTGTLRMGEMLQQAGVIRSTWAFWLTRAVRRGATLQAGEYRFTKPASLMEVFDRIARGDIFYYELVVPEGQNMFDIAASVERLHLFPAARFLEAARDPSPIRDLDPAAPSLEGYLFPTTYRLNRHITPELLCRTMTAKFRDVWRRLNTSAGVHQVVTLASLVEKESKLPIERPIIASVFLRRLKLGMKLDCDPTTIYAALLDGGYAGVIHRSDLDRRNEYNTYQFAGLPPGPIANPGVASMQAVLQPADADYLYFVLRPDGSGGHSFSRDLAEQQAAVSRYRHALSQ